MVRGPSVAIVIPNWNGARYLPDCLNSLEALDSPRDRLEVIVVDNGSTDGSLELLREHYPWVRAMIQQPWEWQRQRDQSHETVLPEDLRVLLARSRSHGGTNGRATARVPRVVWARMPERLQRAVLKVLRR